MICDADHIIEIDSKAARSKSEKNECWIFFF